MPKYNFPMKLYFEERYRVKSRASVFHDFELVVDSKLSYSQIKNALMDKYKTINNLTNCLKEDRDCLNNFKVQYKNNERKIGKNLIEILQEYLT